MAFSSICNSCVSVKDNLKVIPFMNSCKSSTFYTYLSDSTYK